MPAITDPASYVYEPWERPRDPKATLAGYSDHPATSESPFPDGYPS